MYQVTRLETALAPCATWPWRADAPRAPENTHTDLCTRRDEQRRRRRRRRRDRVAARTLCRDERLLESARAKTQRSGPRGWRSPPGRRPRRRAVARRGAWRRPGAALGSRRRERRSHLVETLPCVSIEITENKASRPRVHAGGALSTRSTPRRSSSTVSSARLDLRQCRVSRRRESSESRISSTNGAYAVRRT